ncbi:hypothetical protein SAMN05443247_06342 [Bradyrhizobium erythrophlei]|jgi:hypothetical protein|nr:hypothetical protein SAMN05443247_06342 [Bradyrhizobium erythrophlei]
MQRKGHPPGLKYSRPVGLLLLGCKNNNGKSRAATKRRPLGGVSFNLRGFVFLCVQIYNGLRKFGQGSIGGAFLVKCLLQQRH